MQGAYLLRWLADWVPANPDKKHWVKHAIPQLGLEFQRLKNHTWTESEKQMLRQYRASHYKAPAAPTDAGASS